MRSVQPKNQAKNVRVKREGDKVVIELSFHGSTTKTARINAAAVATLEKDHWIDEGNLRVHRKDNKPHTARQKVDSLFIYIGGDGPDLAVVSRATFLRNAQIAG